MIDNLTRFAGSALDLDGEVGTQVAITYCLVRIDPLDSGGAERAISCRSRRVSGVGSGGGVWGTAPAALAAGTFH